MGGAPAGDLYVIVHVTPHRLFGRSAKNADDLTLTVPVTFPELALGTTLTVPTLDGEHGLAARSRRAPAAGARFRVRGRGVQKRSATGDLLVTVEVAVPATPVRRRDRAPWSPTPRPPKGDDPRAELLGGRRDVAMTPPLPPGAGQDSPVFVISVAAELAGLHAQTLRSYDRLGLVRPGRSAGGGRRYSARDIALLREVQRLSQEEGVNLAGHQADHRAGAAGRRAARPAGRGGPGAGGRPRRRRAGRGLGARVLPARPRAGATGRPGHRGVAARRSERLVHRERVVADPVERRARHQHPAHRGPDHRGRAAHQHVVVGPRPVPGDDVGERAALGAARVVRVGPSRPPARRRASRGRSDSAAERVEVVEVVPGAAAEEELACAAARPAAPSSSSSALIGAMPVPPATISSGRWPTPGRRSCRPIGGPIRQVSPTRECATIARLTQPLPTARTWNSSEPSGRGALAGER